MNLKILCLFIAFILAIIGAVLAILTDAPDVLTLWGIGFASWAFFLASYFVPARVDTP